MSFYYIKCILLIINSKYSLVFNYLNSAIMLYWELTKNVYNNLFLTINYKNNTNLVFKK